MFFSNKRKKQKELKRQEELDMQVKIEKMKLEKLKLEKKRQQEIKSEKVVEQKKQVQPKTTKKATKPSVVKQKGPSGKYEIYPEAGMYKYRLKASNGEILAVSFGYSTKKGAENGIATFKKNVETGTFELATDKSNYSFYTLFNNNGARAVLIGESYSTPSNAESAVESVKKFYTTDKITFLDEIPKSEIREEIVSVNKVEFNTNGKYEVFKEDGKWYVRLLASNSEILFYSQGYSTKSNALSGLETINNAIEDHNFTIAKDKQNRYQFKLYSATKQLILSGETYPVRRSCLSAIDSVVRFAKKAKIVEL
jgi:uncharacterized protein